MKEENELPTCATCRFLLPVYCHPWNESIGKGSMSTQLGYVCTLFTEPTMSFVPRVVFQETNTGLCECYTLKD